MKTALSKYLSESIPFPIHFWFVSLLLLISSTQGLSYSTSDFPLQVIDANTKEELIGVHVYNASKTFTTVTDIDGKVVLENMKHHESITFSYIGYQELTLPFYKIRQMGGVVRMVEAVEILAGVVVIGRRDDPTEEIPYIVDRITREEIAFKNSQTAADVLASQGGVYIQKSQMGGGSPVIRGFEANKVLLVMDGVRMNNAIYREGHIQNSITIDNAILEQAEIIYGPGSLIYGSDALGGVVHFRSRDPKVLYNYDQEYELKTNANVRFATANLEKSVHLDFDYAVQNWGSMTSITFVDYEDLMSGKKRPAEYPDFGKRPYFINVNQGVDESRPNSDPNIQVGTGYSQLDLLQKIKYQPKESFYLIFNLQYSTSSNVPRYDMLTDTVSSAADLKWAEWHYGPQNRLLGSVKAKFLEPKKLYDKATIIGAYQRLEEDRLKRKLFNSYRTFNSEDVHVFSFTTDLDKYLDEKHKNTLAYGLDYSHNIVKSVAGNFNVREETVNFKELTRYPSDGSTMTSFGAYVNYKWKNRDSTINFSSGLRYSNVKLFAKYKEDNLIAWPDTFVTTGVTTQNDNLTWATGLTLNSKTGWQAHALISSAFRSPNIDDFAKIRVNNGYVLVPNIELKPEKAITGELTLGKMIGNPAGNTNYKISGTAFYTRISDAIIRANASLFGDTMLVAEDRLQRVQKNINANSANIYGFSANVLLNFNEHWKFRSNINFVKGRSMTDGEESPLAHIPPTYGQTGLTYQRGKFKVEAAINYNAKKPISEYGPPGSSDNEDEALPEGTLGWTTYNLYTSFKLNEKYSVNLAAENILDLHYRPFASGVSAPGRNFIISVRGEF